MKEQKVFRAGNSRTVVAIPREVAERAGLGPGQKITVSYEDDLVVIRKTSRPGAKKKSGLMSQEFKKWLERVLVEDKGILDELSQR